MKSLHARLEVGLIALLATVLLAGSALCYRFTHDSVAANVDQFVRDKALILADATNPFLVDSVVFQDRDWRGDRYTPFGQTFTLDWKPAFVSHRLSAPIMPSEQARREAAHPLGIAFHDAVGPDGSPFRLATVRIDHNGTAMGYAQIGVRSAETHALLRRVALALGFGSLITLALAWTGIRLWLHQWRAPLRTFENTAREIQTSGVARHRFVAPPDAPELGVVAESFNQLLDRLASAQTAQQRFVADASHELRTPLTVLRGELEVALRRDRSDDEYRETIRSCREEIERLSRLADNLLALARLDAGSVEVRETVDLGMVTRAVVEEWGPFATEKGVRLRVEATDTLLIRADQLAMERVLGNLLDNALRFTPAGEEISIFARRVQNEGVLEIRDQGPGISPEHLGRIFDRFYRVDSFRSRDRGGAGLGLAIVKTLVESHAGSVSVQSEVGIGSTFTLRFPLLPEAASPEFGKSGAGL